MCEHIPCGYSMSTIWTSNHKKTNILYIALPLTKEERNHINVQKYVNLVEKKF